MTCKSWTPTPFHKCYVFTSIKSSQILFKMLSQIWSLLPDFHPTFSNLRTHCSKARKYIQKRKLLLSHTRCLYFYGFHIRGDDMLRIPLHNLLQSYYLLLQRGSLSGRKKWSWNTGGERGKNQVRQMNLTSRASTNWPPTCFPLFCKVRKPHFNFKQ